MECREVVPGVMRLVRCLGERLGSFSALLTGSWARGEARGALSDLDLIIFTNADSKAAFCCWGLPYECDLIFVKPDDVSRLLEAGFLALIEGLWYGVWVCRDEKARLVEEAWAAFLKTHVVEKKGDYWVIKTRLTV